MEHIYHVQHEVMAYYQHIPKVPEGIEIDHKLLFGMTECEFVEQFRCFIDLMKRMYIDMEARPEEYGLLLIPIGNVNENKADGNLAKASWRSVKRFADVIASIGRLGVLEQEVLCLPLRAFKESTKKVDKLSAILNRLIEFGFSITEFDGRGFRVGCEEFCIEYPAMPKMMRVLKAYAVSEPFHLDDPHEFYYFDYKRVAAKEKLPRHCVAYDLAGLLAEDSGELLVGLHKGFVDELGYLPHYKDDSIEYYKKKKRIARIMIDFHLLEVALILKLKEMDRYMEQIQKLPDPLRQQFERGNCRYCGFQNATVEHCKFRITWTLENKKHHACNFSVFQFDNPKRTDAEYFIDLMKSEYE